ncbi:alpha/beta hydrolase family protein [Pseudomonas psychrophila]|uniref:alpha/beta hydrolase family protein n=1 Tax=Pseudomonas psychrophila TaxID=122355 RepID=UPI003805C980
MFSYRLALPALCLSLLLPLASPALATETETETEAQPKPAVREPLPERSQEDAAALERQVPQHEQQQLQAPGDSFLALWKPANSNAPKGAVIIIPGAGETADWPLVVGPLRNKLPNADWASLSLSLPDMQSEASQAREVEAEKTPTSLTTDSSSKAASTTAKPIEQAASAGTENAEPETAQTVDALNEADAERIFARIDAAISYAQQHNMRSIVLLGHGTGAYWASRYISAKHPAQIQKLIMISARNPVQATSELSQLTAGLNVALLDIFYKDQPLAREDALQRVQASKRANGSNFKQVGLFATPGNRDGEQEQLFRRVRGWLSPQPVDK